MSIRLIVEGLHNQRNAAQTNLVCEVFALSKISHV
jgi:hypothetical protein